MLLSTQSYVMTVAHLLFSFIKDVCCEKFSMTFGGNILCLALLSGQKEIFEVALSVP